jgi:hypothetical protein
MRDKHIWDRPTFVVNTPRWTGIILSKRGNSWTVSDVDQSQSALLNASLTGCDGEGVEDLARKNHGEFRDRVQQSKTGAAFILMSRLYC